MDELRRMLADCSTSEARDVIYYLVRYFKQSLHLEEDGKDIFDDVFDRAPADRIRKLTFRAISSIEAKVGKKASEFDDPTSYDILDQLTDLENELQPEFSDEELREVSTFLSRMGPS